VPSVIAPGNGTLLSSVELKILRTTHSALELAAQALAATGSLKAGNEDIAAAFPSRA
jgi:hypothetical protein